MPFCQMRLMRLHSRLPGSPTSCVWNLIVEFTAAQIHLYRGRIYQKVPKTKSLEKKAEKSSVKNPKQLRSKWYFKLLPSLINARTRGFLDREPALVARQLHHCAFWCHCTAHGLKQPSMRWWDDEIIPGQRSVICSPASETCRFRDFFFTATRKDGNPASLLSQKWKKNPLFSLIAILGCNCGCANRRCRVCCRSRGCGGDRCRFFTPQIQWIQRLSL